MIPTSKLVRSLDTSSARHGFFSTVTPRISMKVLQTILSFVFLTRFATAAISGVEFSVHENGVWQSLGNGTLTSNGWELSGITLRSTGSVTTTCSPGRSRARQASAW